MFKNIWGTRGIFPSRSSSYVAKQESQIAANFLGAAFPSLTPGADNFPKNMAKIPNTWTIKKIIPLYSFTWVVCQFSGE